MIALLQKANLLNKDDNFNIWGFMRIFRAYEKPPVQAILKNDLPECVTQSIPSDDLPDSRKQGYITFLQEAKTKASQLSSSPPAMDEERFSEQAEEPEIK